jgi:hypothetical protein
MKTLKDRLRVATERREKGKKIGKSGHGYTETHHMTIDGIKISFYTNLAVFFQDYPGEKAIRNLKRKGFKWNGVSWEKGNFKPDAIKEILTS